MPPPTPALQRPLVQTLLTACQRGAELDVSLALVKATARPGVHREEVFDDVCDDYGLQPCNGCGQ